MQKSIDSFRHVRSFVLRQGRITKGQQTALTQLSVQYCLDETVPFEGDLPLFGKQAPLTLEIGFGMGHSFLAMAQENPDHHFVGVEVHAPGVGRVLQQIAELDLKNIRLYQTDVVPLLENIFPAETFDRVLLFFPDPWPKKRHHKRRLVQPEWVARVARVLKPGGVFHLATDVAEYAQHMQTVLEASPDFKNVYGPQGWAPQNLRHSTKFEARGLKLGDKAWDLLYTKTVC